MRVIKQIVLHCSDSDDSIDFTAKDIDQWHRERGFLSDSGISIGYHYVIRRNGLVERGRPDSEVGAHVAGHNSNSIGICWVGRKQMSKEQTKSLYALVRGLMNQYRVPLDKVYGHCELNPHKTCPNLDMNLFRAELLFVKGEDEND